MNIFSSGKTMLRQLKIIGNVRVDFLCFMVYPHPSNTRLTFPERGSSIKSECHACRGFAIFLVAFLTRFVCRSVLETAVRFLSGKVLNPRLCEPFLFHSRWKGKAMHSQKWSCFAQLVLLCPVLFSLQKLFQLWGINKTAKYEYFGAPAG